jgi:hypothetical protein
VERPETQRTEPKLVGEILDRRNELAGNLSPRQELDFIRRVNRWLRGTVITTDQYKHLGVRIIALRGDLDAASRLDRSASFIARLMADGERAAGDFLDRLMARRRARAGSGR